MRTQEESTPLRLWPGVVIVILQWLIRFFVPFLAPETTPYGLLAGLAGAAAILLWWLFFSRAPLTERLGAAIVAAAGLAATYHVAHKSISTGAMGMLLPILAAPGLSLALVAWAVAARHLTSWPRRAALIASLLIACGIWTLVRTGGVTGNFDSDLKWRWERTPEEDLLARSESGEAALPAAQGTADTAGSRPVTTSPVLLPSQGPAEQPPARIVNALPAATVAAMKSETAADWTGFRGPNRDGVILGTRVQTDWTSVPPLNLWRRPVGPGWSSFAVRGGLFYTQEQRGSDEIVACYKLTTGEPVWAHRDTARFWESNSGAGPRATPTLSNGRVYSFGATGILNALDAGDGTVAWSRDAAKDADAGIPQWGFSSSPLVADDEVIVYAGRLVAYDLVTGDPRWYGPKTGVSYSSPQLFKIGGENQVLMSAATAATGVTPAGGTVLWQYPWGPGIVQPAETPDGDILISAIDSGGGIGLRRITAMPDAGGWTVRERWTSKGMKPYFNDFVVHNGYAWGFDGSILACIDLTDGRRIWKGGRYGNGQLVLLSDQDLLLVLSEDGELALVRALPDRFTELARIPAIKGKTWNHPVLVGDILLVRNGQEMAAFRLSPSAR